MQELVNQFQKIKEDKQIKMNNPYFNEIIHEFSFYFHTMINSYDKTFLEKINKSTDIVFDICKYLNEKYIIICFNQTLILVNEKEINQIIKLFFNSNNNKTDFFYLKEEINHVFSQIIENSNIKSTLQIFSADDNFKDEINAFSEHFKIKNESIKLFWNKINKAIAGFLIKKSYKNSFIDRIQNQNDLFNQTKEQIQIKENNYIIMKQFNEGMNHVRKIYHIEQQRIFVIKIFSNEEKNKLSEREYHNYLNVHHPFLLKCYGSTKIDSNEIIILEYFEGTTLDNIQKMKLNIFDKIDIIIKLTIVINHLHKNHYIYRDLKPNNVMINKTNTVVLIDLDRMIKNTQQNIENSTALIHQYAAPEIAECRNFSYSADIYSLGLLIYYIVFEEIPDLSIIKQKLIGYFDSPMYKYFCEIIIKCIIFDPIKRSNINDLFISVISIYLVLMCKYYNKEDIKPQIDKKIDYYLSFISEQKNSDLFINLGILYSTRKLIIYDINKAIYYYTLAANMNDKNAQYFLGNIYYIGVNNKPDIDKAIHYYTLAANQNSIDAQLKLGLIFFEGKHGDIEKSIYYYKLAADRNCLIAQISLGFIYKSNRLKFYDINKAIHYFTLAANQNDSDAQYQLGNIYSCRKFKQYDINKSIYYTTLAANQNHPDAQMKLGLRFLEGKYVKFDITKAIKYFTLSANQNNTLSNLFLGYIYGKKKYKLQNIDKAIHHYTIAANQKDSLAQFRLGVIYFKGKYVVRDIDKCIYYFTLAANQNHSSAQYNLGLIYHETEYGKQDIKKAIYYYSLAAKQNNSDAQCNLGFIYCEGKYVKRDINKAIYYYSMASGQNNSYAQYNLGVIYFEGEYVIRDINKAIYYFTMAANHNQSDAQFILGLYYYSGLYLQQNLNKSFYYFSLAANQNNHYAQFTLGVMYAKGEFIPQDINQAIHYFKESSSFNDSYAKNNLAIIYKNGIGTKKNIFYAIELLQESIRYDVNNIVSMYNLSHIYFYEKIDNIKEDDLINLLIKSFAFPPSKVLLCIFLIEKYKMPSYMQIENEILLHKNNINEKELINMVHNIYQNVKLYNYDYIYMRSKNKDYMFDCSYKVVSTHILLNKKKEKDYKNENIMNINKSFYEGFSI